MKTTALFLLPALLLAGCAEPLDPLERAALEASRHGTVATYQTGGQGTAGIEAAGRVTARYYWVAKYAATAQQREVATARGKAVVKKMQQRRVKPKTRYIAVATKRDARATTKTSVMLFDTKSEQIVGNDVYDLNAPPPAQTPVRFETYSAAFVGVGG